MGPDSIEPRQTKPAGGSFGWAIAVGAGVLGLLVVCGLVAVIGLGLWMMNSAQVAGRVTQTALVAELRATQTALAIARAPSPTTVAPAAPAAGKTVGPADAKVVIQEFSDFQ